MEIANKSTFKPLPKVSIIVLNWNGLRFLDDCFGALARQTYTNTEVIFVDNGSTDDSVKFVTGKFPWVKIILVGENLGFCGGNNVGLKQATGDLIALLNTDTSVAPNWLADLVEPMLLRPEVGMTASRMVYFEQPDLIDVVGEAYHVLGQSVKIGHKKRYAPPYDQARDVFGSCAGAALYRRELFDTFGLLDETFQSNKEDTDLNFRCQLGGWKCHYVPSAVCLHHVSATYKSTGWSESGSRRSRELSRNSELVFFKNLPWPLLLLLLLPHLGYSLVNVLNMCRQGNGKAAFEGKLSFLRLLPHVWRERKLVQGKRKATSWEILKTLNWIPRRAY